MLCIAPVVERAASERWSRRCRKQARRGLRTCHRHAGYKPRRLKQRTPWGKYEWAPWLLPDKAISRSAQPARSLGRRHRPEP